MQIRGRLMWSGGKISVLHWSSDIAAKRYSFLGDSKSVYYGKNVANCLILFHQSISKSK